jgi:hypothetical protein
MARASPHETLPVTVLLINISLRRRSHILLVLICLHLTKYWSMVEIMGLSVCLQFSLLFLSFAMFRNSFRTSVETVKRRLLILLCGTKPLPSNQCWLSHKTFAELKVCKSAHHRTIQINHQPDATIFHFIILTFIYSSTCFGRSPRPLSGAQWLQ